MQTQTSPSNVCGFINTWAKHDRLPVPIMIEEATDQHGQFQGLHRLGYRLVYIFESPQPLFTIVTYVRCISAYSFYVFLFNLLLQSQLIEWGSARLGSELYTWSEIVNTWRHLHVHAFICVHTLLCGFLLFCYFLLPNKNCTINSDTHERFEKKNIFG